VTTHDAAAWIGAITCMMASSSHAQINLSWSTIDCGGAGAGFVSTGSTLELWLTIGQPESGTSAGGDIQIGCGYSPGFPTSCYPNCDGSTVAPVLTANDFTCFLTRYVAGEQYANCDGSTVPPVLTANDFTCFLTSFVIGCS
jgi:hypothetical protein